MTQSKAKLRSQAWFGGATRESFVHRSWMRNFPADVMDGRPVIGICNTFSELSPCNAHLRTLAESVKRGVWEAGGFPLEFPVMSLGESNLRPTAMLYRNLASMDVEESIRGNPIDGVILLVGCDKTTPALLMGAASCNLPTIAVSGGPMLRGTFRGQQIGSGTDLWRFSEDLKAGRMSAADFAAVETGMNRSAGSCNTMGTASTMASLVEALGVGLSGNAAIPAVDSRRAVLAHLAGRRIVELVHNEVPLSRILTREAFENAIRVNAAIGGSTNAIIHLIAIAGRLGVPLTLDDWDRLGRDVPTVLDLMPSGRFLMEDFAYAGGLQPIIRQLGENHMLHRDALTVNGKTIWDNASTAEIYNSEVIRPLDAPLTRSGGIATLRGNLAPNGAVIKPSAATPALMKHSGRAVVFENIEDYRARIDDPTLDIDEFCVMVLKNCGPRGYPGMAEVGNMSLPAKILARGITDMVRISDARMSGTAYGTVVLHVAPEAAVCGPLALVRSGDPITLDVDKRALQLEVSEPELTRRRSEWLAPPSMAMPGYQTLYVQHTLQADRGCDFDFLVGPRQAESHANHTDVTARPIMPTNTFERSKSKMSEAAQYLAGGVSSNFRLGISPTPLVIQSAHGPYVLDADDNCLIDYYLGMGPMILGHNPPSVIEAAKSQLDLGILFAGQTEVEFEAARLVCELVPCAERVRFGSSGTEVIQAALRLARAATGRQTIIKFEGHYHGWLDNVQWSVAPTKDACGPVERPYKVSGTPGQDRSSGDHLEILGWNDLNAVVDRLAQGDVAAIIMEPAMCNTSAIAPCEGYLEGVREVCSRTGTILIFDEVITGFRLSSGGAQKLLGVTPDLATFGKAIANGFPVAALTGRADLMDRFVAERVMHGGTYNGHPVNMAATVATLNELKKGLVYSTIEKQGRRLMDGISDSMSRHAIPGRVQGFPGIFHVAFGDAESIETYRDTFTLDRARYVRFTTALLERGVRALERGAWFLSSEHNDTVIDQTLEAIDSAAKIVA